MNKTHPDTILIIDFGSQVTQLIARRIREVGIYSEIVPFQTAREAITRIKPKAIILSGSPHSILDPNAPRAPQEIFSANIPILGICYGEQLICAQLGGRVESSQTREFGRALLKIEEESPLFDGVWEKGKEYEVWMSHGDRVSALPPDFKVIGTSPNAPFAAIANESQRLYAVQFHPEVVHTPDGAKLLQNFVLNIAGLNATWSMAAYREQALTAIKAQVGENKVICGLSGGVDSSVAAVLIHQAIGSRLTCIFVDHGLLRKNEAENVVSLFRETYNILLIHVDASETFLTALEGVVDPEEKRKIIGRLFIKVFEEEARKIGGAKFLAQGTLYPDVIESVSFTGGPSVTIKSHHNVGGLPKQMNMQLVEPLRSLFKDEVRALGRELGLPEAFIKRHPFPGPGLAIRCPGAISPEKLAILREADSIYLEEIHKADLYDKIWQAFVVLLPVQSVGVMGDSRTYEYVCALRAVTSLDGMTADFYPYDMAFLSSTATRIINEVPGINRVVYDITSKPPSTIEWE
ncbi:glutamine-hydrolyzing GMP synthase [Bartonella sp. DGB2]|uniref:glutamine-hydrolyzing GMP synthase n=1 Tax=Bartonella sp. DGB2 TaxID=3388426 RepID=UPI0039901DBC